MASVQFAWWRGTNLTDRTPPVKLSSTGTTKLLHCSRYLPTGATVVQYWQSFLLIYFGERHLDASPGVSMVNSTLHYISTPSLLISLSPQPLTAPGLGEMWGLSLELPGGLTGPGTLARSLSDRTVSVSSQHPAPGGSTRQFPQVEVEALRGRPEERRGDQQRPHSPAVAQQEGEKYPVPVR